MLIALYLIGGLVFLVWGAHLLVQGASKLALSFGISSLVVGLTVVAFGTSAPEMSVSVMGAIKGETDLVLGNVVGSNIFNVLFILGASALVAPLTVHRQIIRLDVPLMIVASLILWGFAANGVISRVEASLFLVGLITYTVFLIRKSKKESPVADIGVSLETKPTGLDKTTASSFQDTKAYFVLLVIVGLAVLVLGSKLFVSGAIDLARLVGLSELVIGLTIVAAGTSLPEVAASLMATIKGERDIAVGNVIGSNLFNLLGVLGLAGLVGAKPLEVAAEAMSFDIPVMTATALVTFPICLTGQSIKRWEGFVFLGYYVVYTAFLVMLSNQSEHLLTLKTAMVYFVLPLTFLAIATSLYQHWQKSGGPDRS